MTEREPEDLEFTDEERAVLEADAEGDDKIAAVVQAILDTEGRR